MLLISYVTCVDIISQVSLTRWLFLFLDVSTRKLGIIVIILSNGRSEIILPIARTTKNEVAFALENIFLTFGIYFTWIINATKLEALPGFFL